MSVRELLTSLFPLGAYFCFDAGLSFNGLT